MKDIKKKIYFTVCFYFILNMTNISYCQSYECDNNFGNCGTPEQSGGGGGKGVILIDNTDIGDTYQNADDYDDDGIEDPLDNCMRQGNPYQYDMDGDGIGDMCDNCLEYYNPMQEDYDADGIGDFCDSDIDGDGVPNSEDGCVKQWGDFCTNLSIQLDNEKKSNVQQSDYTLYNEENNNIIKQNNCNQSKSEQNVFIFIIFFVAIFFLK